MNSIVNGVALSQTGSNVTLNTGELGSVTTRTQLQEVLARANSKAVVVDFTAKWCGPCKKIAPQLHQLAATHASKFEVYTCDVDESAELVDHFQVTAMPSFVFFYQNRVVHVLKGASSELLTQAFEIISSMIA